MRLHESVILLATLILCVNAYTSKTPLIRNIWRTGIHLEGPHWTGAEEALYFVDIAKQLVHRYDPDSGNVTNKVIGYGPVTPVVTVKDNPRLVLICVRTELYFLSWDSPPGDDSLRLITPVELGHPHNRCNDGKVDAKGRLWVGTMGPEVNGQVPPDVASFYMVDKENYLHPDTKVRPVSISNGLAWTEDNKFMFYIDTPTKNVDVFDFDVETGDIRNRRTLFSFVKNNVTGLPDGMTIDTDGNLWVACFNGGKVIKVDSRSGKLLEEHRLPATKVTSVMWGGKDLATLFVTTARVGLTAAELAQQPEAGSLFAIEGTGSRGRPEYQFIFPDASSY